MLTTGGTTAGPSVSLSVGLSAKDGSAITVFARTLLEESRNGDHWVILQIDQATGKGTLTQGLNRSAGSPKTEESTSNITCSVK